MEPRYNRPVSAGTIIINQAKRVNLNPSLLYEAVIDLSSEGLITANCINRAAGILLNDLGLPNYFFETIKKASLKHILFSIARSLKVQGEKVELASRVADINFDDTRTSQIQRIRIATRETRDAMETMLESQVVGHRREYYYNPEKEYYTYMSRPETVADFSTDRFSGSRFLFGLDQDYIATPRLTRDRYERLLNRLSASVIPEVEVFNLSDIGEIRFMFNLDFERPQLALLRKLFGEHGLVISRAYWEPYANEANVPSSICSLYVKGELPRDREQKVIDDLRAFLSFSVNGVTRSYVTGQLTFKEMLFAGNAADFTHMFIYNERGNRSDRELMEKLPNIDHKATLASRIHESNKSTYTFRTILESTCAHPDLIKFLYRLFNRKFNPAGPCELTEPEIHSEWESFRQMLDIRFMDDPKAHDIFSFMFRFITAVLKTNFYKPEKRSFCFRLDNQVLDPLVYDQFVFGIFFANGHYACGTHLRADDIARGGLRMIRVTPSNHGAELDNAVLLNYALGPKAQRLKHKDICESGSKGVVVPHPLYAAYGIQALYDYTEGIMDLIIPDPDVKDHYGKPEMVFFGPDEGTAPMMDAVAYRAKERGYHYWRTLTTGKSFGIPHDTYGLLENGDVFGLTAHDPETTELTVNGESKVVTGDMDEIWQKIGGRIEVSGMTTTSVMGAFRAMISHYDAREEDLNLMMTGGPDGDLGANEIQCYKGKICLIIDGGSILFDPDGLDKEALMKIGFMRHTSPRINSLGYPVEKLGKNGFQVPLRAKNITLPDGRFIEDGAIFHRQFITDPANRKYIKQADIRAFIPCGGFKDTVNRSNVREFTENFNELRFIVEGANVFFDDAARRHIAASTPIKQIKDSTANKGGVFSSAVAEVLTAFLFNDAYEKRLLEDMATRWELIRGIMELVSTYAAAETDMLLRIHEAAPQTPLFMLSVQTSEQIFSFMNLVSAHLESVAADEDLLWEVLKSYIPRGLVKTLGKEAILLTLNTEKLVAYRNAIITKKMASLAFYAHGTAWKSYTAEAEKDFMGSMKALFTTD